MIKHGCAYVDDQSAEDIRKSRGTLTEPGKPSPHRSRSPETLPKFALTAERKTLKLKLPKKWLDDHPLTQADLELETGFLKSEGYRLRLD